MALSRWLRGEHAPVVGRVDRVHLVVADLTKKAETPPARSLSHLQVIREMDCPAVEADMVVGTKIEDVALSTGSLWGAPRGPMWAASA